jgi:hypothetical protein
MDGHLELRAKANWESFRLFQAKMKQNLLPLTVSTFLRTSQLLKNFPEKSGIFQGCASPEYSGSVR